MCIRDSSNNKVSFGPHTQQQFITKLWLKQGPAAGLLADWLVFEIKFLLHKSCPELLKSVTVAPPFLARDIISLIVFKFFHCSLNFLNSILDRSSDFHLHSNQETLKKLGCRLHSLYHLFRLFKNQLS